MMQRYIDVARVQVGINPGSNWLYRDSTASSSRYSKVVGSGNKGLRVGTAPKGLVLE
jgi:hypothetical protein